MTKYRLDKKCLRVLPTTFPCYSNVASSHFQSAHFFSNMGHGKQEKSLLAYRDKPLDVENLTLDKQCFQEKFLIKRGDVKLIKEISTKIRVRNDLQRELSCITAHRHLHTLIFMCTPHRKKHTLHSQTGSDYITNPKEEFLLAQQQSCQ